MKCRTKKWDSFSFLFYTYLSKSIIPFAITKKQKTPSHKRIHFCFRNSISQCSVTAYRKSKIRSNCIISKVHKFLVTTATVSLVCLVQYFKS